MARQVYLDRHKTDEALFVVSYFNLRGLVSRNLDSRDAAESYAQDKAGKRGMVISTLDMAPAQLQKIRERYLETHEKAAL